MATSQEKQAELAAWSERRAEAERDSAIERIAMAMEFIADHYDKVEGFADRMLGSLTSFGSQWVVLGREPNGDYFAGLLLEPGPGEPLSVDLEVHCPGRAEVTMLLGLLYHKWLDHLAKTVPDPF